MADSKTIFNLDNINFTVLCSKEDKMKDICQKYVTNLGKNINTLLFLYKGNKVNFESRFKDQSNGNNEIKISVYKYENDKINCPKCGENIKLNRDKMDDMIKSDNMIKNNINEIKLIIDKIKKNNQNESVEAQLKNINELLNLVNEDNNLNMKNLLNLFSEDEIKDKKDIIKKDILVSNNVNPNNIKFFGNIKSKYIVKKIFEHLDEKKKINNY